jgi:predicted dehydrogenase
MVRFGIVGFGLHAEKRLMPGFALAKNCRVTALSRRNRARAEDSARAYGIGLAFDSAEELVRSREVDAVFIATPNACHRRDVLAAIAARKPVLCEKPLAVNAREAREMVEAAQAESVLFGVAQVFRFHESLARFRDSVAAGQIGEVIFARSEFSFTAGPTHPRKWIYDRQLAGAGPIFDVGVHSIDSLRFVLQDEVSSVAARVTIDPRFPDVESAAALTLEFSRGTLATVLVSFRAGYRTPFELVGARGVVWADDALNVEHPIAIELRQSGGVPRRETVSNHLSYALQVDRFAAAIEGGPPFPAPAVEGWQNQEILDAAVRSIESGRVEPVPRVHPSMALPGR